MAIASICTALGDQDRAMEWLEKACQERDHWIVWSRVVLGFHGLEYKGYEIIYSGPRFQDLMRRIGLPS